MKLSQVVVLTIAVVVLIFIATFASMYLSNQSATNASTTSVPTDATPGPQLLFPLVQAPGNPLNPNSGAEHEWRIPDQYDFWFLNDRDTPVTVRLKRKTCKCSKVEICIFSEEWKNRKCQDVVAALASRLSAWTWLQTVSVAAASSEYDQRQSVPTSSWQPLDAEDAPTAQSVTVPPKSCGWARMSWTGERLGQERLTAELWTKAAGSPTRPILLSVSLVFNQAIMVLAGESNVGTLSPGDQPRQTWFECWSSTRAHFGLQPESLMEQQKKHPFVICGTPVPLTGKECYEREQQRHETVLSGYRIPVTVYEHLEDGRRHDMGPFQTQVTLTSDSGLEPFTLTVTGEVRGELVVVTPSGNSQIGLGTFPADLGKKVTVSLESEQLDMKLLPDTTPDFIKIRLEEEPLAKGATRKSWRMILEVIPNGITGQFPRDDPFYRDSAIYLKVDSQPPRRIRIPVWGNASVR